MAVMVTAGAIAVALTGCKEQGQVLRVAGLKKTLLESLDRVSGQAQDTKPPVAMVSPS